MNYASTPSTNRKLRGVLVSVGIFLALALLMMGQSRRPNVFASPLATQSASSPLRGVHLGNHYYSEGWHTDVLRRIDGDNGGTWPNVVVVLSQNVYDVARNTTGDCRITNVVGRDPVLAATSIFTGYLQRASTAGVKIIIRIRPSPGNFITSTHHISLTNAPANGNRCDDGSSGHGGNRSYDDVGSEIIKIHEWNATHGITETGFEPASEPNIEWYSASTLIPISAPTAWSEMDAYFSAVYDYVHAVYPTSTIRVLTPPMSQSAYAEIKRFGSGAEGDFCLPMSLDNNGGHGYTTMSNVFSLGTKNDGYDWHNYWKVGYEAWGDCDPNASPHGQHVAYQFPYQMVFSMLIKPRTITEADLASPPSAGQFGDLSDKDSILGFTAANSLNQFFNAGDTAERIAVWGLNVTDPADKEQNWHEAYRCNDVPNYDTPALERPWFTLWWTGWPGWPALCYKTYLAGVMNNYTTELIKNGNFDASGAYWTTTTSQPSCTSPVMFGVISDTTNLANTIAADLGRCNYNTDTISQIITIPDDVTSATLSYKYRVEQTYTGGNSEDFLYVQIHDYTTGEIVTPRIYGDGPPRRTWINGVPVDLSSRHGHTIEVIFRAFNGDATYPANFWVDDVSVQITY